MEDDWVGLFSFLFFIQIFYPCLLWGGKREREKRRIKIKIRGLSCSLLLCYFQRRGWWEKSFLLSLIGFLSLPSVMDKGVAKRGWVSQSVCLSFSFPLESLFSDGRGGGVTNSPSGPGRSCVHFFFVTRFRFFQFFSSEICWGKSRLLGFRVRGGWGL